MTPEPADGSTGTSFGSGHPREQELVGRAQAGDHASFGELVEWYAQAALSTARRLVGAQDGADAVQEAFIRAFRGIGAYRGEAPFGVWLKRIVYSTAFDHHRRRRRRHGTTSIDGVDERRVEALWQDPAYRVEPERVMEAAATRSLLVEAMERLSEVRRTVLILHDVQGATSAEIAEALGMPLPTVKSHLRRARMAMVTMLAQAAQDQAHTRPAVELTGHAVG
jgi:RNA polymerase sigma-70 factor (ECF subfamily)